MFSAIADGFSYLFSFLGDLGLFILNGILKLLQPILDFFGAIFYFISKLGLILVKIIQLVIGVAKLLIGLVTGLFNTITGLNYTGQGATIPTSYQRTFNELQPIFATFQLDKIAYIFMFALWIFTAITATRIIGKMGGGTD